MVIREQQIQALSDAACQSFQRQLVQELREFAPWHAEILGESGLLCCVQFAMARARRYGFTNRGPIRLYLQMIFLLGADFDTDPSLPWACRVLLDDSIAGQTQRATQLYARLNEYLAAVAGPENSYAKEALRRASQELARESPETGEDLEEVMLPKMRRVYPQKCEYTGELAVRELIRRGIEAARRHAVGSSRGGALFCGLMFALGHGFEADPHLPWIQKTLNDPALTADRLVERLSSRVRTYLEYVLVHVG